MESIKFNGLSIGMLENCQLMLLNAVKVQNVTVTRSNTCLILMPLFLVDRGGVPNDFTRRRNIHLRILDTF